MVKLLCIALIPLGLIEIGATQAKRPFRLHPKKAPPPKLLAALRAS